MDKLILAAAGAVATLGVAAPAAAKPAGVELAMADYARATAAPDAPTREAALRTRHARHAAHRDCGDCGEEHCAHCVGADCKDEKIHCAGCEEESQPAAGGKCDPASHQGGKTAANA